MSDQITTIFDADNHYWETSESFTRHRDPKFAERGVRLVDVDGSGKPRYMFDGWLFDLHRRSLTRDGGTGPDLTTSEFNLLEAFVKRPHRALSRDDIMDLLKGQDWSPIDRSIDNLIARLRKKIEHDPDHPALIKTVRGIGYIFAADVKRAGPPKD